MVDVTLKKEFRKRSILLLLIPVYLVIYVFFAGFGNILEIADEIKYKDLFIKKNVKINQFEYRGGGSSPGLTINIIDKQQKKYVLYSFLGNGFVPLYYAKEDSIKVLINPKIEKYAFIYEENLILKRIAYFVFNIIYIILGIIFFYFVRKQHLKVKKLAPYGVDENYEPLPKPAEKFNFNKYD